MPVKLSLSQDGAEALPHHLYCSCQLVELRSTPFFATLFNCRSTSENQWWRIPLFDGDSGRSIQCKCGNKPLALDKGNAVFVKALADVEGALQALYAAAAAVELDEAIKATAQRKKPN